MGGEDFPCSYMEQAGRRCPQGPLVGPTYSNIPSFGSRLHRASRLSATYGLGEQTRVCSCMERRDFLSEGTPRGSACISVRPFRLQVLLSSLRARREAQSAGDDSTGRTK